MFVPLYLYRDRICHSIMAGVAFVTLVQLCQSLGTVRSNHFFWKVCVVIAFWSSGTRRKCCLFVSNIENNSENKAYARRSKILMQILLRGSAVFWTSGTKGANCFNATFLQLRG